MPPAAVKNGYATAFLPITPAQTEQEKHQVRGYVECTVYLTLQLHCAGGTPGAPLLGSGCDTSGSLRLASYQLHSSLLPTLLLRASVPHPLPLPICPQLVLQVRGTTKVAVWTYGKPYQARTMLAAEAEEQA